MLVITRKPGEWVRVRVGGVELWVGVSDVDRNKVRLAFDGPRDAEVLRAEKVTRDGTPGGGEQHKRG